jgi:hypothetical protein
MLSEHVKVLQYLVSECGEERCVGFVPIYRGVGLGREGLFDE